ncbi:MAG: DUF421 domain-containing protein [Clostridia bacterium]|nr:DUF421 domain-containing protein [Clostridia bacterium]
MGKRQIGEMQPFEFVITLIIADLACIPMAELSVPLVHGIVPIITLLIFHFLICVIARKSLFARYLISGRPAIVISPKGINYNELKSLNMTLDDLMELIRGCDVFKIEEIAYAILETNGKLCILKKAETEPVTRDDLNINVTENSLPINLVMDGQLMDDNMKIAGVNREFIDIYLEKSEIKKIKEVLLMTLDKSGLVFIQGKFGDKYYTFQSDFQGGEKW